METTVLFAKTLGYVSWQSLCYAFGRERIECIRNIANYLAGINIIYSKVFQSLSAGANILSIEEMKYLSQFNDTAPFNKDDVFDIKKIVDNLNKKCDDSNLEIKCITPQRAGMVALVYYGTVDGKDVVVKVKRRNIEEKLADALDKMRTIVNISSKLPWLNRLYLPTIFEENRDDMVKQLDFSNEVNNLKLYNRSFRHMDFVKIPYVYEEFTKGDDRVIVMERLYGTRLHDIKSDSEKAAYGPLVARFSMKSILYDRRYHADLHAGNIFFMGTPEDRKIGIIDFGIVGSVTKEAQDSFYNFFKCILVDNDNIEGSNVLLSRLVEPKELYKNMCGTRKDKLLNKMALVASEVFGPDSILDARTVYRINTVLIDYGLQLSRQFCRIQLSLAVCASVCNELCKVGENYMYHVSEVTRSMMAERDMFEM